MRSAFLKHANDEPKPFIWMKGAGQILASIRRFWQRTLETQGIGWRTSDSGHWTRFEPFGAPGFLFGRPKSRARCASATAARPSRDGTTLARRLGSQRPSRR